jgi:alkylation response protein AidB-like acyl-CoA dehydrogenase
MSQFVQRRDIDFLLHEVFDLETLLDAPRYRAHDRESISAMLDSAEAVARKHFLPIAGLLDANEPKFVEGRVEIPSEARAALRAHAEAGFFALGFDEADGGLQAPTVAVLMASGIFTCANLSLANYAFLTVANANMLRAFGTEDQRRRYLPPMLEGRWFGTMCLSEPQAGSSLADIATKAEPLPDSFYRLKGSKMWISGGDHELADNIVHMVLAKIPGGLPGVKGISLFLAPRYRVEADGSLGSWNNIALAGLNHKMGQRGTVNCLLNFSEGGDTLATLIGEPGKGLAYMFHMMNEARLGVGHAAAMCGLGGYLSSLEYARQRLQGRLPNNKDPSSPPVPIIEHADVKRMLLAEKAAVEGAMALTGYCAYLVDLQKIADDAAERERLDALLGVLTPVAKSWPSEHCLEANKHAIQILGGYGYTRDFPVERFYRDNRLNPIHEGALGIQAIDLLGRKVRLDGGLGFDLLCAKIEDAVALGRLESELSAETAALQEALDKLRATTRAVLASNDLALGLANATIYLDAFGHVLIGWMWLWQATVATRALHARADGEGRLFYMGKLAACRYFFRYELPKIDAAFTLVGSLDDACLSFESSWF